MSSLLDPDCRQGKHGSCVGGPCECACHEQPAGAHPGGPTRWESVFASCTTRNVVVIEADKQVRLEFSYPPQPDDGDAPALHQEIINLVEAATDLLRRTLTAAFTPDGDS